VSGLDKQLVKGQERYRAGYARHIAKVPLRPATFQGIVTHFNQAFKGFDWGEPPLLTKKTEQMLKGFIRLSLREDREPAWIYELVFLMAKWWEDIKGREFITQNGKPWVSSPRPSLNDLVVCSGSIISHIEDLKETRMPEGEREKENVELVPSEPPSQVAIPFAAVRKRVGPTQEEEDEAFMRIQEDE